MEQIIQQVQDLENLNRKDEEAIERERNKHHETTRSKERILREIEELDKRNQALSESILQFEVTLEGVKQDNNDIKSLLKESKDVSICQTILTLFKKLREMQEKLAQRKKAVDE